jgi:hypothetical protein
VRASPRERSSFMAETLPPHDTRAIEQAPDFPRIEANTWQLALSHRKITEKVHFAPYCR